MKNKKILFLAVVSVVMFALPFVSAHEIYGTVYDSAGVNISGATVVIVGETTVTTDSTGFYNATSISAGNYTGYAEKSGYYRGIASIEVTADTSHNFTLSAPNYTTSDLDDIVIDVSGTALVEVKGDVPEIVDILVLALIVALLGSVLVGIVGLFVVVPKMMSKSRKNIRI